MNYLKIHARAREGDAHAFNAVFLFVEGDAESARDAAADAMVCRERLTAVGWSPTLSVWKRGTFQDLPEISAPLPVGDADVETFEAEAL